MKIKLIDYGYKKIPSRQYYNDSGNDVYLLNDLTIKPNETVIVPCGFGIDLPTGYNAHFQCRTSVAKQGVFVQQCAIDAGYKGEINMIVQNLTNRTKYFQSGSRLAYIIVYPIVYVDYVVDYEAERKNNGFGSTGK